MKKRKLILLLIIIVVAILAFIIIFSPKFISKRMTIEYCAIVRTDSGVIYLACKNEAWADWLKPVFELKGGMWVLSETEKPLQNYGYLNAVQIKESDIPIFPVFSEKYIHRDYTTKYLYENNYILKSSKPVSVGLILDTKGNPIENFIAIIFREGYKEHIIEYTLNEDNSIIFDTSFFRFIAY